MIKFMLAPQYPALLDGYDNETHVIAKLIAPERPSKRGKRKNLNLSIVIDRSGSMAGHPLEEAKRCAITMVEGLEKDDRVSIVQYDSRAQLLIPSTLVARKYEIQSAIKQIDSGGATDLFGGWSIGAREVSRHINDKSVNRVLLLSDGNANNGLTDSQAIQRECERAADNGVSTSTYGLGHDFNENLMMSMAKFGRGQGYYGQTADDLEDPYHEEFELLKNTVATNLEIFIEYPDFVKAELLNSYVGQDPEWKMPDLAYEGEAWALFKLNIDKEKLANCKKAEIFKGHISYTDLSGKRKKTETKSIRLEPINQNAFGALVEYEEIKSRILEVRAAVLQRRAREAAYRYDWVEVDACLAQARHEAGDNAWVQSSLNSLQNYADRREQQSFAKEAFYASDKLSSRLKGSEFSEMRDIYSEDEESNKMAYLRRKVQRGKRM